MPQQPTDTSSHKLVGSLFLLILMEQKLQVDLMLPSGTLPGKLSPSYHRNAYSMESAQRTTKK